MQLFRREGRAVDAVLADTAAGHDDDVADLRFLLIALAVRGGLAGRHFGGDQADGAAIDQRLAEVALVEHDGAVDGGDAGLVAAVFHAFAHAFEDAAGMEQAGGQGFVMEGGREAEHVGVADEFRAEAGAHRVAVHPHDAGQRPAVGVEGRGAVVRFHLDAGVVFGRKGDDARVVLEHGTAEIPVAEALADLLGRVHDAGFVEAVDCFAGSGFLVGVGNLGRENLVLAVFRPRLGEHFELGVGGIGGQAEFLALRGDLGAGEPVLDLGHFLKAEGQRVLLAHFHELRVAHRGERHDVHFVAGRAGHAGGLGGEAGVGVPLGAALDFEALDKFVGEEVAGDAGDLFFRQRAVEAVLDGGVYGEAAAVFDAEHERGGIAGGTAFIVRNAGAVTDFNDPRCAFFGQGQGRQGYGLQHRIVQHAFRHERIHLLRVEPLQREHFDRAHGLDGDAEGFTDAGCGFTADRVVKMGEKAGFNAVEHVCLLKRLFE